MNNELQNNSMNQFQPNTRNGTMSSIAEARERNQGENRLAVIGQYQEIKEAISKAVEEFSGLDKVTKTQEKRLLALKNIAKEFQDDISSGNIDLEEQIKKQDDALKLLEKHNEDFYIRQLTNLKELRAAGEINDKDFDAMLAKIEQANYNAKELYDQMREANKAIKEDINESNRSMSDAFKKNLSEIKGNLRDIAVVGGLDKIYGSMTGETSINGTYQSMRRQYGFTTSEFNKFKNDLTNQLVSTNSILDYGFGDTLDYMNKLGELGITNQDMAKSQYMAVMEGTKYLGLQTETQAKILKISRTTGDWSLLQTTNETMVKIMNAQLGISKDQLAATVGQAAQITDLTTLYSGNADALQSLTKYGAAIESTYGVGAKNGAFAWAQQLLSEGANAQQIAILGDSYGKIMEKLYSGDGSALDDIIQAVQSSYISKVAGNGATQYAAMREIGFDDNALAMYNSRPNGSVEQSLARIEAADNSVGGFIKELNQNITDKFGNLLSNLFSYLPFGSVLTLQNTFYALSIVELLTKLPASLKLLNLTAKRIEAKVGMSTDALTDKQTGMAALSKTVGTGLIIAGLTMAVIDAIQGAQKADEWDASKGASAIGGFLGGTDSDDGTRILKNTGKYALVGAGIGTLIAPGAGSVIGAVIGALAGLALGAAGGESIANTLDSFFGTAPKGVGSSSSNGVISSNIGAPRGSSNNGAAVPSGSLPWSLTSPFGYRGRIWTPAGWTNPFHNGIDLAKGQGTPIGANHAGRVSGSGTASDGANYVLINTGDGMEEMYWHLQHPSHLKVGDSIREGQLVGYMGMSGMATGPHLHFGRRKAGSWRDADFVDPINMLTTGLFSPTDGGYPSTSINGEEEEKSVASIKYKLISADTLGQDVLASGVGSPEVVDAINTGFTGLYDKLDELSSRQDSQEMMLRALTSSRGSEIYKY